MDRTKEFYIYPRDKSGKKTGHVICVILRDGQMFCGTSLCSPEDNFEYKKGKELAKERAEKSHLKCLKRHEGREGN